MAPPGNVYHYWVNPKHPEAMRRRRTDDVNTLRKHKRIEILLRRRGMDNIQADMDTDSDMDDPMDSSKPMEEDINYGFTQNYQYPAFGRRYSF